MLNVRASRGLQRSKYWVVFCSVCEFGVLYVILILADCIELTVRGIYMAGTLEEGRHCSERDTSWLLYE